MTMSLLRAGRGWSLGVVCTALAIAASLAPAVSRGQEPAATTPAASARTSTALAFVPEDASFFVSRLRMREQIEAFMASKAVAKLMAHPLFNKAKEEAQSQAENLPAEPGVPDLDDAQEWFNQPENKELTELLLDAASHEIFVYGGADFTDMMELFGTFSREMDTLRLEALAAGTLPSDPAFSRRMGDIILKHLEGSKVPQVVIGCRLSDPQKAEAQLARLEALLAEQLPKTPEWEGRLKREQAGRVKLLTLQLDGTLVPPEAITPAEDLDPAQRDRVIALIRKKTMSVSIGLAGKYLLLSIGRSNEHLATLGQEKLLIDRKELAPLATHADKPLTSVVYVSGDLLERSNRVEAQLDSYVAIAEAMLPQSELEPRLQQELIADAKTLASDLKKALPKPGPYTSFAFRSPRGLEGYSYNWSENWAYDGSQPLSILDHVGGSPIGFAAARWKYAPENFESTVKWVGRGFYYFEQIGLNMLEPEQQNLYGQIRVEMMPLVERLNQVVRQSWIPAFKDGQGAIVLDAQLTSKKWHREMPEASEPLPMLELGFVYGVSDASLVTKAAGEAFAIVGEALRKLNMIVPEMVPPIELPVPASREFPPGTVYYYNIPEEAGIDPQIAPNAALSGEMLALSYVPKFGLRLLTKTPLVGEGPLAAREKPLAAAGYFSPAKFVTAIEPWIIYSIDHGGEQLAEGLKEEEVELTPEEVKEGTRAIFDFVRCLKSMSSVTYLEEGALVTHSEWHLVDPE
jgi:hypothetical protein